MAANLKSEKYARVISLMKKATIGDVATRRLTQEFKEEVGRIEEVWQVLLILCAMSNVPPRF